MYERLLAWARGLPPLAVDLGLTLIALVAQLAPFASRGGHWPLAAYAVAVAVSVPVVWRRRAPFAVLLLTEAAAAGYDLVASGPRQPLWYGALIAMFTVAAQAPRWQRISAVVIIGWGAFILTGSVETAARGALLWTTAYVMGRAWANRREEVRTLRERARHLERERELEAERERSRIARDMHDILAHAVSITIAQAEAGPVVMKQGPARTEEAFDAIAAAGREAMAQLRRILGVLDAGGEGARAPQPTLAGIAGLVASVSQVGGTAVSLNVLGQPGTVTPDAEVAAYRIVQEALTNVLKHARARTVTVTLDWRGDGLAVTVTDDGRGPQRTAGPGQGHGLIGIRERAASCGGSATAGPAPGGRGFQVRATLPGTSVEVA
ncbi:two-component sensor histidine kinase [Actinoplanes ianthinogenes]|uniref:histidine kinase n=1 Tax=Actinoplanes ianthinogenes TaxID=122358 RepID=A0ABM7LVW7_9ACTN|nr:histidine kinase [Actinoplanes ianthinogenes]BCJ43455.1 two-component sensor histidine kinase [Actinoplanes ianthinogenes]GGR19991.1 two-component sensor histidine kinase [Actinoplanes ianthinogenes]